MQFEFYGSHSDQAIQILYIFKILNEKNEMSNTNLDLINIDVFEFFFHLFCSKFHSRDGGFCILQSLGRKRGLLHVKWLQKKSE